MSEQRVLRLYPGISLILPEGNGSELILPAGTAGVVFCREGRLRLSGTARSLSAGAGDAAVLLLQEKEGRAIFSRPEKGICILVEPDKAPENLSQVAAGVDFPLKEWLKATADAHKGAAFPAGRALTGVFDALSSSGSTGYKRVKLLELFLLLDADPAGGSGLEQTLAKEAGEYLAAHLDGRVTLIELSRVFHVSGTRLKRAFKEAYGVSVYTYARDCKMEEAARLLKATDLSVLEIAGRLGYENGSKFASAFRSVKGKNPSAYRTEFGNR